MSGDLLAILDAADAETALTVAKPKRKKRAKPNAAAQFAKAIDPPKPARPALPESVRVDAESRLLKNRKAQYEITRREAADARAGAMPVIRSVGTRLELLTDSVAVLEWACTEAAIDRKWTAVGSLRKQIEALHKEALSLLESAPMSTLDADAREAQWRDVVVPALPTSYLALATAEHRRRTAVLADDSEGS